ncbi:phosphatidylglycerol--membrane-oligosaccharide glycerophosphotransferase [Vreelandella andesensis]|uniref:Phosphatidylglycerol--membrane-oligosaccharide glycerophosphotransferase n=1 Tax=Vreelandella andesensis TaxID=447567 RepID=A0A433KKS5_9GAMM|nr:sulfatase-like hydrolase/transferase [Halomonas andesensis]RUR30085.1 phosphatidylglycerol--membrane-oligosaccharide glycerophosphotransferase [Halomonas andesensis]
MSQLTSLKFTPWLPLFIIGANLGYTITVLTRLPWWTLFFIAAVWFGIGIKLRWGTPVNARYRSVWPWSLVPLCMLGIYIYLADSFGNVDLGAVFFHLQAGMAEHGGAGKMLTAVIYTISMIAMLVSVTWLTRHDQRWRLTERFVALFLLAANPMLYGLGQRSAAIVTDDGAWLDRRYVPPTTEDQTNAPNLLVMYLESIERTYSNALFGDAYTDLTALGERGLVFEGIQQMDNTGWTMAGMIASQCGVPLMPAGLLHDSQFDPLSKVVPGVDCLGDVLAAQGYRLSYLGGASIQFAGKGLFYRGHQFNTVKGKEELSTELDDPEYINSWGLYDDTLYDFTVDEIRRLSEEDDGPWALVNLSIAGHAPSGFPSQTCLDRQGEFDGQDILYSVECSASLTRDLIERLEKEGLLENTLVVVLSDHLTMRVSVWDQLTTLDRDNTLIMLGDGITPLTVRRGATMLDVFPTILDVMGLPLNNKRAGLGASLLSTQPTLVETHGLEVLNERLREETALQQRLWEGLSPQRREPPENADQQVIETPADQANEVEIIR